jgi:hypothetical protein
VVLPLLVAAVSMSSGRSACSCEISAATEQVRNSDLVLTDSGPFYAQRRHWDAVMLGSVNASSASATNQFGAVLSGNRTMLTGESALFELQLVIPQEELCSAPHASVLVVRVCVGGLRTSRGLLAGDPDLYMSFSNDRPSMTSAQFVAAHKGMVVLVLASDQDEWLDSVPTSHTCHFPADRGAGTAPMRAAFRGSLFGSVTMRQSGSALLCARAFVTRAAR